MSYPNDQQDIYQYGYGNHQIPYGHAYIPDGCISHGEESNFWPSSSPRTDSPSPNGSPHGSLVGPYQIFTPTHYNSDQCHPHYKSGYTFDSHNSSDRDLVLPPPYVRVVKRRTTANKKERRRTQSINNAYADLRDCIPNVPADTKLSKIKTLRLATSYIAYLTGVLETDDPQGGFRAELGSIGRKSSNNGQIQVNECSTGNPSPKCEPTEEVMSTRRGKGRTGWPQHVWALELKQEPL